jgi:hypothetical protein
MRLFVMSVRLAAYTSAAPTGRISVKFDIGEFYEKICLETPNLVNIGQKYRALHLEN